MYTLQALFEQLICLCGMRQYPSMASSCQEHKVQTPYISCQGPPKYSLAHTLWYGFLQICQRISASVSLLITFSATIMTLMPHHHQISTTLKSWFKSKQLKGQEIKVQEIFQNQS